MNNGWMLVIYFFYGLAFFIMGISCLFFQASKSRFVFRRSLFHLALFGLTHGSVEWLIMFRRSGFYDPYENGLIIVILILYVISFFFLYRFSIHILSLTHKKNKKFNMLFLILLGIWAATSMYFLSSVSMDVIEVINELRQVSRYVIAFFSIFMTMYALYRHSLKLKEEGYPDLSVWMFYLTLTFAVYLVAASIIGEPFDFFPANIFNKDNFFLWFRFPVEVLRATSALIIMMLVLKISYIMGKETEIEYMRLLETRLNDVTKRRMVQQLHDVVLQKLFVSGLTLDQLLKSQQVEVNKDSLATSKQLVDEAMLDIRAFINEIHRDLIKMSDLCLSLNAFVLKMNQTSLMDVRLRNKMMSDQNRTMTSEQFEHIMAIVSETYQNALKHGKATQFTIQCIDDKTNFMLELIDNGIGFDEKLVTSSQQFGLRSIRSRVSVLNGTLQINSSNKKTIIRVSVPLKEKRV